MTSITKRRIASGAILVVFGIFSLGSLDTAPRTPEEEAASWTKITGSSTAGLLRDGRSICSEWREAVSRENVISFFVTRTNISRNCAISKLQISAILEMTVTRVATSCSDGYMDPGELHVLASSMRCE